jgi:hypothetical protein
MKATFVTLLLVGSLNMAFELTPILEAKLDMSPLKCSPSQKQTKGNDKRLSQWIHRLFKEY